MEDLLKKYGLTEAQLERLLIAKDQKEVKPLDLQLNGDGEYVFGAIGDTHLCSKQERLRELATFYKLCQKRGVKDVFHSGDILDGMGCYAGQEYEVHTFGADAQTAYCVAKYPKVEGITTHFILGN